jgi:putative CocE/NonD family hydrolase
MEEVKMPRARSTTVEDVRIPMADGVRLAADVYREDAGPRPTILLRTPYGRRLMWQRLMELDPWQGAREGFAVVFQDSRGRGDSEGEFQLKRVDAADGAATVEWIRTQPWSDGRVVMAGMSWDGIVQFRAASAKPPGLVAIAPTMSGEERAIWFWNGALRLHAMTNWVGILIVEALAAASPADRADLEEFLSATTLDRFHAIVTPGTTANRVAGPVLEWFDPDPANDYYGSVGVPEDLEIPGLHITGWYDVCRPATLIGHAKMSASAPGRQFLVIGPWAHDLPSVTLDSDPPPPNLAQGVQCQLDFFRHVLGVPGAEPPPVARTYVIGAGRWVDHDSWPPARTRPRRWLLAADGGDDDTDGHLVDRPAHEAQTVGYEYDPDDPVPTVGVAGTTPGRVGPRDHASVERRRDVLTFTAAPVVDELELCGNATDLLPVGSSAPATDFVARLTVVKRDGRSLNLSEGYWSGSLRDLPVSPVNSSLRLCEIDVGPVHALIAAGECLRLHVTSSDYPEVYPNPNTGHDPRLGPPPTTQVARQALLVGGDDGASLTVAVRDDA